MPMNKLREVNDFSEPTRLINIIPSPNHSRVSLRREFYNGKSEMVAVGASPSQAPLPLGRSP